MKRELIAYHEAGHCVMAALLGAPSVASITKTDSGWAGQTDLDGTLNKVGMITFLLGGFAVWAILSQDDPAIRDQIVFSEVNRSDLERVRQITGRQDIKPEFLIVRGLLEKHWQNVEQVAQGLVTDMSVTVN